MYPLPHLVVKSRCVQEVLNPLSFYKDVIFQQNSRLARRCFPMKYERVCVSCCFVAPADESGESGETGEANVLYFSFHINSRYTLRQH